MAKTLDRLTMFMPGDPDGDPTALFMTYSVVDGKARKDHQVYEFDAPALATKSIEAFWAEGVAAIKTNEGIS